MWGLSSRAGPGVEGLGGRGRGQKGDADPWLATLVQVYFKDCAGLYCPPSLGFPLSLCVGSLA